MKNIKGIMTSGLITAIVFLFVLGLYIGWGDEFKTADEIQFEQELEKLKEVKLPSVDKKRERVLTILDRLDKVWSRTEELYPNP